MQFQPDGEQQQGHAEVGDLLQQRRVLHPHAAEYEARGEETHERRQADHPRDQPEHEGHRERQHMHDVDGGEV